jgi:hypothetical protein
MDYGLITGRLYVASILGLCIWMSGCKQPSGSDTAPEGHANGAPSTECSEATAAGSTRHHRVKIYDARQAIRADRILNVKRQPLEKTIIERLGRVLVVQLTSREHVDVTVGGIDLTTADDALTLITSHLDEFDTIQVYSRKTGAVIADDLLIAQITDTCTRSRKNLVVMDCPNFADVTALILVNTVESANEGAQND